MRQRQHKKAVQREKEINLNKKDLRSRVKDDKEPEELKQCWEVTPDDEDDVTIDATPLSSKSPIVVDYKIYKEGKKNYFQL
nr:hypothetical protein [Tanacetum cinerariifolium]